LSSTRFGQVRWGKAKGLKAAYLCCGCFNMGLAPLSGVRNQRL
jgi:hypothetical protein